jgi:hypothetical protein
MTKFTLPQEIKLSELLPPAADAAGRAAAAAISLKNVGKAYLVFHITQGNAATILLTPMQASAVAKTGGKVLTNTVPIWANLDTAAGDTMVRATDAVNYTTDAGVKNKIVMFEIDPALLDIANGFDCIYGSTGASNVANITQAYVLQAGLRYQQATPPASNVD